MAKQPKRIKAWANDYNDGDVYAHNSKKRAKEARRYSSEKPRRVDVLLVEVRKSERVIDLNAAMEAVIYECGRGLHIDSRQAVRDALVRVGVR